jgi:membrane protein CcdC involved in cytochrome C biogenesis
MDQSQEINNTLVLSYLDLRKSVGVIGTLLPFVVSIGKLLVDGPGVLSSVSTYYYSTMRDVFVGSICAIGVFLWSYRGYDWRDAVAATVAAFSAIGLALFPIAPDTGATASQITIGNFHIGFAAVFFLTLAYFSLVLFRKTRTDVPPTHMKLVRNKVYTVCGYTILTAILLIAAVHFLATESPIRAVSPVFWLEALACVAFGVSWFVKGEAILKDGR